jgi:biotin operon repressor
MSDADGLLPPPGMRSATRHFAAAPRHRRAPGPRHCARCGAPLAAENHSGLCFCHPRLTGYRPHHDRELDHKLLILLHRAAPEGIDLAAALGTAEHKALHQGIVRLRRAGHAIEGLRPRGYRLTPEKME